jgi:RNA polymerase sigma-70 factor (ECF subfamily)
LSALARCGVRLRVTEVNGQPAMAFDAKDRLVGVMALDIAEGQI